MMIKNSGVILYLSIYSIKEKNKFYWLAKITNKNMRILKEFIDSDRWFAEVKGLEWMRSKSQLSTEIDDVLY